MRDDGIFSGVSFPLPIESIFNRVISIDWYDGTTSGLALDSQHKLAFSFGLLDWGPCQELRIFALSPLPITGFDQAVMLFSKSEAQKWPIWYLGWPSELPEQERTRSELGAILALAGSPEFAFASQSRFQTILAATRLSTPARAFLPTAREAHGSGHFDYWQKFLELPT